MVTYQQLSEEDAWNDEYAPAALRALGDMLRAHFGAQTWIRGDNDHLRGYHRSRRWINESIYCTNRVYSVSRTSGDRSGGDSNWACAMDLGGLPQAVLHQVCRRLDAACRAGQLEKITEWYGNLGGDSVVDGWDNISNRPASSDSSHLTHLHMSFDRGRANDNHSDLFLILTGGTDVNPGDVQEIWQNYMARNGRNMADNVGETFQMSAAALAKLDELLARPQVPGGDPEAFRVIIRDEVRAQLDATKLGPAAQA